MKVTLERPSRFHYVLIKRHDVQIKLHQRNENNDVLQKINELEYNLNKNYDFKGKCTKIKIKTILR